MTVAEIAVAADVSEKTVFNHFATKEELVFAGGDTGMLALVAAVRDRPAGTAVLDVFRASSEAMLDVVARGETESSLLVPRIVRGSPHLQERLTAGWAREVDALAAAMAEATGADPGDLVPDVVARTLAWTLIAIFRQTFAGLLAGEEPAAVAARMRPAAARAYDQLAAGLGDYGVSSPATP